VRNPRVRLLAAAAAPIFFLTACGGDDTGSDSDSSATSAVVDSEVTSAPADDAAVTSAGPATAQLSGFTVDKAEGSDEVELLLDGDPFTASELPFTVDTTSVEQLEEGEGEEITADQEVTLNFVLINATNGDSPVSTYKDGGPVPMDLTAMSLPPAFVKTLPGQKPGASFVMAVPPADGFGAAGNPDLAIGPEDTMLFYVEVVSASTPLTTAEGEAVAPVDGLPTVETDGESAAVITIPEGTDEPSELVVQPLIEGEGPEVEANQTIKVHYTGVTFSDGEQFDSSYTSGAPFSTVIGAGQVIPGWDEGLIGQNVGSRVLMVIPAEQAYGPEESGNTNELAGETLVFVVDILSAN